MENNQLDLSFFPLTSFSSDAKLFGEEKRRNDRSKLRRKAEEKIINRFNELCPEALTGKLDLIIDDTVEIKRGKFIEGSCRNLWNNKEHRTVKGLNIVSLNYSDCYTDMMLDFL